MMPPPSYRCRLAFAAPLPRGDEPPCPHTSTPDLRITFGLSVAATAIARIIQCISGPDHRLAQVSAADLAGRNDALIDSGHAPSERM